jgi:hypothetical protein
VNLSLFVVENKGIEVSNNPIQGRIMVATQDFNEINEAILREAPTLVCKQQDYLDIMERFLDLPMEVQVGILDLYFQPLDMRSATHRAYCNSASPALAPLLLSNPTNKDLRMYAARYPHTPNIVVGKNLQSK